jgi:hypothetical protein
VSFIAQLDGAGDRFTGTIEETDMLPGAGPCSALVDGRRAGNMVFFTKTYDGRAGFFHSVAYEGTVNADATEIHGSWSLPTLSGTFLMIRPAAAGKSATRQAEDRADTPERVG